MQGRKSLGSERKLIVGSSFGEDRGLDWVVQGAKDVPICDVTKCKWPHYSILLPIVCRKNDNWSLDDKNRAYVSKRVIISIERWTEWEYQNNIFKLT